MKDNRKLLLASSILSCTLENISGLVKKLSDSGIDALHIDVMDGSFVPNFTFGAKIVEAFRMVSSLYLDVHIMAYNPFNFIEPLVKAGANSITIHFEASEDTKELLKYIRSCGVRAGLAFSPSTSIDFAFNFLDLCDMILVMSVEPGFSGQNFKKEALEKISLLREYCNDQKIKGPQNGFGEGNAFLIQVDGGINNETAKLCEKSGSNFLVSGDYLFKKDELDLETKIKILRGE